MSRPPRNEGPRYWRCLTTNGRGVCAVCAVTIARHAPNYVDRARRFGVGPGRWCVPCGEQLLDLAELMPATRGQREDEDWPCLYCSRPLTECVATPCEGAERLVSP